MRSGGAPYQLSCIADLSFCTVRANYESLWRRGGILELNRTEGCVCLRGIILLRRLPALRRALFNSVPAVYLNQIFHYNCQYQRNEHWQSLLRVRE